MTVLQVGLQIKFISYPRMTLPGYDHIWFFPEPLLPNAVPGRHGDFNGQIDGATCQFGLQVSPFHPRGRYRHSRGGMGEAPQQGGKNQGLEVFPQR